MLDRFSCLTGLGLLLALAYRLLPETELILVLAGLLGYVAADLASGTVHWFCDTYFAEDTPVIGPLLIAPFREHHVDALAITRHDVWERNGNSCLPLIPILAALVFTGGLGRFWDAAVLVFAAALMGTNQIHCWAHARHAPGLVRWLQQRRLILDPESHRRHHRPPNASAYCITTGWLNPLLDRIVSE